jgi:YHS domain-containing protein
VLSGVRLAILALWIALVVLALLPLLRRRRLFSPSPPRPRIASDELVKDPVCGTYIVRSRAVSRGATGGPPYFCSAECAGRFVG